MKKYTTHWNLSLMMAIVIMIGSMALTPSAARATAVPQDSAVKARTIADVPNMRLQDKRLHVSDPDGILSAAARDSINRMLTRLESATGIETAVVMLPSIGDKDVFDFAHELFRSWGIGKKKSDNGLLILYVADIHRIRFTTGYGIEGSLTDAMSKRIQQRYMVPAFRQGNTDLGMVSGVSAVCQVLDGTMKPERGSDDEGIDPMVSIAILAALFVLGGLFFRFVDRRRRKCPHCGRLASLKLISRDEYRHNGRRYMRETYICQHCGQTTVKTTDISGGDNGAGIATGAFLGSMMGGRHGGGGFNGGSFGGGSTGGGGADSGW